MAMKPELHGYRVWITCPIYCNGKFTHNSRRFEIIHLTIAFRKSQTASSASSKSGAVPDAPSVAKISVESSIAAIENFVWL